MLMMDEAYQAVIERAKPLTVRRVPLLDALGCILAEDVHSDADSPPFDKAVVDGFAVRSSDVMESSDHCLKIGEEITAGQVPTRPLAAREAAVIMTGAPLPPGADAVVMLEKTRRGENGTVLIQGPIRKGEGRLTRGREFQKGESLFERGKILTPATLGVLAAVGMPQVSVIPRPRAAIVPTGDELVSIEKTPGPGQIRETNSILLAALVHEAGGIATVRPTAKDETAALRQVLSEALGEHPDMLIVCGGVSAGKRDLVPQTLEALGIETIFHKVRMKPGKPLLFGVDRQGMLVFGLPGNPVSGLVSFLLFVKPALEAMRLGEPAPRIRMNLPLASPFQHRGDRPTYHPGEVRMSSSGEVVVPLSWNGSADLFTVARSNGFIRFPEGDREYETGEMVEFVPMHQRP